MGGKLLNQMRAQASNIPRSIPIALLIMETLLFLLVGEEEVGRRGEDGGWSSERDHLYTFQLFL